MREEIKNTKKLDNKGFSLIELIIVIAIMAILVGIVGTQVVPYIEKSKEAKDMQVISSVLTNATTAFAANAEAFDASAAQSFKIGADMTGTLGTEQKVSDEFKKLSKLNSFDDFKAKMSSKAGKAITSVTIARAADGTVTVTVDPNTDNTFNVLSST